ncbi:hypothetical protein E2C01_053445 [Portunus trituberculatus]|uniref:Uncharacterized protein n=1 Tax=Portunus trituberculatus TaxID=210409 RepID=A0A5B7GPG8_PORTR|nr:hypothetical protein [Portunus trituberculatus]
MKFSSLTHRKVGGLVDKVVSVGSGRRPCVGAIGQDIKRKEKIHYSDGLRYLPSSRVISKIKIKSKSDAIRARIRITLH